MAAQMAPLVALFTKVGGGLSAGMLQADGGAYNAFGGPRHQVWQRAPVLPQCTDAGFLLFGIEDSIPPLVVAASFGSLWGHDGGVDGAKAITSGAEAPDPQGPLVETRQSTSSMAFLAVVLPAHDLPSPVNKNFEKTKDNPKLDECIHMGVTNISCFM